MDVILMTILLTVLGVCLVAFFTFLGITSYKLMKFRKKAEGSFKHLERWIDDNQNAVFKEFEIRETSNQKQFDDLQQNINQSTNDLVKICEDNLNTLTSKIDSRCDKLQDKFDNLKKDVETNYELSKDTQKRVEKMNSPLSSNFNQVTG